MAYPFDDPVLNNRFAAGSAAQTDYDRLYNEAEAAARARSANFFEPPEGNPSSLLPGLFRPSRQRVRTLGEAPWEAPTPWAGIVSGSSSTAPERKGAPAVPSQSNPWAGIMAGSSSTAPAPVEVSGPPSQPTQSGGSIEDIKSRLGFSWGRGERVPGTAVELGPNGRPTTDSVLTDPTSGRRVQAHESTVGVGTGGGGFIASAPLESIPYSQWPESAKEAQIQQAAGTSAVAEASLKQAQATDPFKLFEYGGRKSIDVASEQDKEQQVTRFLSAMDQKIDSQAADDYNKLTSMRLSKLEHDNGVTAIQEKVRKAKEKLRADYAIASGKVTTSFQPDRQTYGIP